MALAIKRENDLVTVLVGIGSAVGGVLATCFVAILSRRTTQETEFVKELARELSAVRNRVTDLEGKVRLLESELDTEREQNLRLTAERDAAILEREALKRENAALTERCVLLSARNLELETKVAARAFEDRT